MISISFRAYTLNVIFLAALKNARLSLMNLSLSCFSNFFSLSFSRAVIFFLGALLVTLTVLNFGLGWKDVFGVGKTILTTDWEENIFL